MEMGDVITGFVAVTPPTLTQVVEKYPVDVGGFVKQVELAMFTLNRPCKEFPIKRFTNSLPALLKSPTPVNERVVV